jgi:sn-glycerol 3-phosphate transport system substrate-binding protein
VEFATHQNGLGKEGYKARLKINSPLHVKHIENLGESAKNGEFVYKGRASTAQASFTAGECAMIQTSSGFYGDVSKNAKFAYGLAPLPYYPDVKGAPQNTVIGGASLWVMAGKKAPEYKGVAKFFEFLSKPEIQAASHQRTGYLPVTMESFKMTEASGFYQKNPGTDVAVNQMIRKVTDNSRGIRLGNYVQIRTIEDEELEQVWSGKQSGKQALDNIVKRGDELLARFERELPGVFDAIDDGVVGKPNVDLFIDDKCLRFGRGMHAAGWRELAHWYGDGRRKDAA